MRKTTRLREMLNAGKTQLVPGVYDGLSARIAQAAGADLLYATGGGIARSTGIPDMGLINPVQITERLEQIVDAVDLPVIADFDTGYGNALNALHTLKGFERAGVAGFHIEDQVFPKRCGHLEGKTVVPAEELAVKIQAIKENQIDPDLVVIARTDALAVEVMRPQSRACTPTWRRARTLLLSKRRKASSKSSNFRKIFPIRSS